MDYEDLVDEYEIISGKCPWLILWLIIGNIILTNKNKSIFVILNG
jgi:hypothetical protein